MKQFETELPSREVLKIIEVLPVDIYQDVCIVQLVEGKTFVMSTDDLLNQALAMNNSFRTVDIDQNEIVSLRMTHRIESITGNPKFFN